ncbi:TIGR02099 family protein [Caenimonas sedimenti]|uniref:TIGR02099 family protein n=1 Tax=Caenimonas sedimenti TaxID=2596921 RepID=A0A562ZM56_9BURK|nr:YhdP family protein [Caenimonas sedimenti]TWO69649.1 TIGR02099 family protein [Caenimonas sedimenti]
MNAPPPIPSRTLKIFAAAVKWSLWLLLAAWLVLALAWGALHAWIVPRIGEFRPALESEAGRVLGVPVRIGGITARSEGLIPTFELRDVMLVGPQGQAALRLPLVVAGLSPRSLWNLGFEQLYIDRPELDIRRSPDGRIHVAGLDFSRASANDGRAADWLFRQTEFVIRGGTLHWTDELRRAPPLALREVQIVLRNTARQHAVRLEATPPPEWGSRFTLTGRFRQPFLAAGSGWQTWVGQVHADFGAVDLSQLRQHANLGFEINQGRGRLRAWADVERGQVIGGTADVVLTEVNARLGQALEPLALQSMSGRLGGKRLAHGFSFETQALQFVTVEGQRWPGGNVMLTWNQAQGKQPAQGTLRADKLDLGALSAIATRLPLSTATHAALQGYAPQGLVESLQARWQGGAGAVEKYEARGRASGLRLAARPGPEGKAGSPGIEGAAVDFDFTQDGGKARLAIERGELDLPGVFEERAVPVDSLAADVQWQRAGDQLSLSVANLKFSNADAQGEGQATWRTGDPAKVPGATRLPGVLDLQGSLSRANGTRVFRYLPLGVNKPARDYVRDSVLAGVSTGTKFRVKGDLRRFPFADGKDGQFLITAQVRDVTFAYVPPTPARGPETWPALDQLSAELEFEGNGMRIKGASGSFVGAPRLQVKADARIAEYRRTEVEVQGRVRGPLADSLAVVNAAPLAGWMNQALAKSTGNGNADLDLSLNLPIAAMERSKVLGTVTLAGNDIQITPDSPPLTRARGVVTFTDKGFQVLGAQARAFGGDVRLEGGTRAAGAPADAPPVLLRVQGTATAEGLRQARELGYLSRLARDFTGSTPYQLALGIRTGRPEILLTSSLQGLALNLPAPLNKSAETTLPLRYENALVRDTPPGARAQDTLAIQLGRLATVNYLRDVSGAEPQVLRGAIGIGLAGGEAVALPEEGVLANVQFDTFGVDPWEDVIARAAGADGAAAPEARPRAESAAATAYLPTSMAVRARELSAEGRTLHNVVVGVSREGRTWRANVAADELNGYVEYREPLSTGAGRLHARLARLSMAAAAAGEVEALLEQQPGSIPALDIVVDDFELKGRKLGRLEIEAVNRGAGAVAREGGVREWRLSKLSLSTPEAVFTASGNWAALGAQPDARPGPRAAAERRRTAMKFQLDIADAGALLARFGMSNVVRRGRGSMEGNVAWLGSPLAFDYPTLTGNFKVNVESGQFLKAEPGLAKLLGVLSLQSLPRRLALDFRDVFSEGFSFDFMRGDIVIEQGIASTNNLQMKGVNAAVLMDGKADIARETQDLKVVVVPEINAGTASLVFTVINPALGLGSFLAQMFLRQPLMKAATQEFHIDGTWGDPRVTRVSRSGEPATTAGPVPPPAPIR